MYKYCLILLTAFFAFTDAQAQPVTNLNASCNHGQVFLTWTNLADKSAHYLVYRSTEPITAATPLASCEYLGYVNSYSSVNHNLTSHDSTLRYLRIDSAGTPLNSATGLFVATTLESGSYYYAVTTSFNGGEIKTIVPGANSLVNSIAETVSKPQPVFQEQRIIDDYPVMIYTSFVSARYAINQPLLFSVGFVSWDFSVNLNGATGNNPVRLFFHGGGADYLDKLDKIDTDEVKVQMEDDLPDSTILTAWWGSNPAFNLLDNSQNSTAPTTGINHNFSQWRINSVIDWVIRNLPVDSNRIYLDATSDGSGPAFFYAITYPQRVAAVRLHVGSFDFSYLTDWQSNCSLNTGKKNRKNGDQRLGTVPSNLYCNLGIRTYEALNGGFMIHKYPAMDYPVIYSVNGRQDDETGWTEKTIFYDSVNANHLGSYFFFDNRDHSGDNGKFWNDANFNLYRYTRQSYPAFAYCSLNEDYGNGDGNDGAINGTVNGTLDWDDAITDDSAKWVVKVFRRNLVDQYGNMIAYPDSCTADITPRRLQHFSMPTGCTVYWNVEHHGQTIQSGSSQFDGTILVIPQVKIFKDTCTVTLTTTGMQTFYRDSDHDGFGDAAYSQQGMAPPAGYVFNALDCNDNDASINPAAADVCNGIDDNCNGVIDENAISVSITNTSPVSACASQAAVLTTDYTGMPASYQWYRNNTAINGAFDDSYLPLVSGNYSVIISNGICSDTSNTVEETLFDSPDAEITPAGNPTLCKGTKVNFTATAGPGWQYQWFKDGSPISNATSSTYATSKKEDGDFSVTVTGTNGCSSTSVITHIERIEKPVATITPLGDLDICNTDSVVLQASSGTGYSYQWKKGSGILSGETNQLYVADTKGNYKVIVSNSSCSKTSPATKVINSCKLREAADESFSMKIAPNPSNGDFMILIHNNQPGTLNIFDLMGRLVFTQEIAQPATQTATTVSPLIPLPDGVYLVQFSAQDLREVMQLVITH